jgi:hypothetical protein
MAKKAASKGGGSGRPKPKGAMSAEDHRKVANTLQAKARIHHAKADLAEALNPPKKSTRGYLG